MADEAKKKTKLELWTPRLTGIHPWLQKADTKFVATGKFRVKCRGPAGEFAALQNQLNPILEAYVQEQKDKAEGEKRGKLIKSKIADFFKPVIDSEGNETGEMDATFSMNQIITYKEKDGSETIKKLKPKVWDSKGAVTNKNPWSGSVLRVLFFPSPYYSAKDNEFGISLKMIGVQIIKLVEASERDAASYGLEVVEDGFTDDFDGSAVPTEDNSGGAPASADAKSASDF